MNHFFFSAHLTTGKGPCIGQLGPWGPLSETKKNNTTPETNPFSLAVFREGKDQGFSLKIAKWTTFFSQPTSLLARGHVLASWDPWDSIRAPKRQYLPTEQAHFPWPLSERGKTSNSLSKQPNVPFFSAAQLTPGKGPGISHLGPGGTSSEPANNYIYQWNKPIFLSCFPRG